MFAVSAYIYATRNSAHETRFVFGWGFAGRIAMLLLSRVAGRMLGIRGPDLARGPEVARPYIKSVRNKSLKTREYRNVRVYVNISLHYVCVFIFCS